MSLTNGWKATSISALAALVLALSSWAWKALSDRVDTIQAIQALRAERITKAEAEISELRRAIMRMEGKLDAVLELERDRRSPTSGRK